MRKRIGEVWPSPARLAPTCDAPDCSVCTGQCLVPRLAHAMNSQLSEKVGGVTTIIHWTVWCAPDCPVSQPRLCQRSVAQLASDAWPEPTVTRPHRTVRCATGLSGVPRGSWQQWSASPEKEGDHTQFTVRCAHGQKATIAFQMKLQRFLAALGL
jgi:hypothetical protein